MTSNKPVWSNLPKWAQYIAMDSNGHWYCYETKPRLVDGTWITSGVCEICDDYDKSHRESLEKRP